MEPADVRAAAGMVGVLALQGDFREHLRLLGGLGASACEVRVPAQLDRVSSLVVPGGESTTISLLLESSGLLEPVRQRLAGGMPALGTCAGMILLAGEVVDGRPDQHYFGAIDIAVRRNAFGRQRDSFEADLDVAGLSRPLHAVFIRAPVVERVGPDVEVLARVRMADGQDKAVVCRQGPVLVSSFHPELVGDPRLHELFLNMHTKALHTQARALQTKQGQGRTMSGHSKWATTKHKKGALDKARGKLFAKIIRQVEVAAREGGGDLDGNATLRTMYQKARDSSVPMETIERAIKRGTGELEGVRYEPVVYEGYAPCGVAAIVECLTTTATDRRRHPGHFFQERRLDGGAGGGLPGSSSARVSSPCPMTAR